MGMRRLQDTDHAMHCLLTECFGDFAPKPFRVSESWLKEHGCTDEAFGDVPVPSVRTPIDHEPPMFDLATYGEIDGEPGRYQLEWFS